MMSLMSWHHLCITILLVSYLGEALGQEMSKRLHTTANHKDRLLPVIEGPMTDILDMQLTHFENDMSTKAAGGTYDFDAPSRPLNLFTVFLIRDPASAEIEGARTISDF